MFKSKLEVDRHVQNCLKKINNETERHLRSFSFGKLYFTVGDYEQANRYVTSYLSVKPRSAEGYVLLGKSLEKLGKIDAALEAYRNSLQIDPKQNNLVIKVCELLSTDNLELDLSGARYFCDLAQSFDPNNPAVYSLKEKLITKDNENPHKITQLLLQELEIRPSDISLRIRLLKHFIQNNMIKEAYKHASAIEEKNINIFHHNLNWYENLADILLRYKKEQSSSGLTYEYWLLAISVLERLVALGLEEYHTDNKSPVDYVAAIFNLDQMLYTAHQNMECADRNLMSIFFRHFHAQLYLHLLTVILKQSKRDKTKLKEASNLVLPLLFTAYHSNPPDLNGMWFIQSPDNIKRLVYRWYQISCYRCSQVGHIILTAAVDRNSILLEKATQYSSGMWREQLYKRVFVRRDQQLKINSSFFIMNDISVDPIITLPNSEQLLQYDEVAQSVYPDSLHHFIWLCLNSKIPLFNLKTFEGMQYSNPNLTNCAAESLNLLDIYSFVYCSTLCASSEQKDNKQTYCILMPASLTDNLATGNQAKFLESAYKMYKNDESYHLADMRVLLIKGLEVVRCVGHHGLDVKLLVALAEIFEERVKVLNKQAEIDFTLARAELYWKTAIPLLEKIKNHEMVMDSNNKLFNYKCDKLTIHGAQQLLEKGKLFMGTQLKKRKEFEKALATFNELKNPYASFYQYEIYKLIADTKKRETGETEGNLYKPLLCKARDCLYLTLDRLREPSSDSYHPLNSQLSTEIVNIERLLSGMSSEAWNDTIEAAGEFLSLDNSIVELYQTNLNNQSSYNKQTPKSDLRSIHSTPLNFNFARHEVRPSPERLDAQIRQIINSRDTSFVVIAEQNKTIVETQKNLLEKLHFVMDDLKSIKKDVENLKEVTKSLDVIKTSLDDFKNIEDVIQEVKKYLGEVKKNNSKNNQLSEEDLYMLDPDYGADFNIASNIPSTYPNYPTGRLTNPAHLPPYGPMLYSGLYPNSPYAYVGLNFAQPGTLPFIQEQQASGIAQPLFPNLLPPQASLPQAFTSNIKFGAESSTIDQLNPQSKEDIAPTSAKINQIKSSSGSTFASSLPKAAPVNVVITNSDPLPMKSVVTSQPVLSVTIPPQHVKNNCMKPLSTSSSSVMPESPFIDSDVQNKMNDNSSAVNKDPLDNSGSNLNFKPIFALPQEVAIYTEEDELFSANVKLFTLVNKEWKEKGAGTLKILKKRENDKYEIIMRKNLDTKICINHFVQKDLTICQMNKDKSVTWSAQGSSDEGIGFETFCARFDTIDEAEKFYEVFKSGNVNRNEEVKIVHTKVESCFQSNTSLGGFVFTGTPTFKPKEIAPTITLQSTIETPKATPFSTFIFGKDHSKALDKTKTEALTFSPLVISQEKKKDETDLSPVDDFVPTAEFKPVIPLPELIQIKTGEEESEVLFESRTKLFRYDVKENNKEWKERGVGNIKILKDNFIRLLMRRDQVHKVCCNHRVLKDMIFKLSSSNPKAVVWKAQDFSEGVLTPETFTARFKTEEVATEFLQILHDVQKSMDENNSVSTQQKESTPVEPIDFNNFRPAQGSWECNNCYVRNGERNVKCLACGNSVTDTSEKKSEHPKTIRNISFPPKPNIETKVSEKNTSETKTKFSFSSNFKQSLESKSVIGFGDNKTSFGNMPNFTFGTNTTSNEINLAAGFGDAFKAKPGTWECKSCLIRNEGDVLNCMACNSPKDDGNSNPKTSIGGMMNFSFGIKSKQSPELKSTSGFGDALKAESGTWECKSCLIRNEGNILYCIACNTSREGGVSQKHSIGDKTKFTFGIKPNEVKQAVGFGDAFKAKSGTWECKSCLIRNEGNVSNCIACNSTKNGDLNQGDSKGINLNVGECKWTFGIPNTSVSPNILNQTPEKQNISISATDSVKYLSNTSSFSFDSAHKGEFEFKQRSPRRISTGQDNESDGNYVDEEEDTIYFKPVIPLPDKVQVKTGEENEDILYCQRAKLFRFVNGEWKERGVGDLKVLRNRTSQKLRVLMRRDQVLKICLNHLLTKNIEYIKKDEKSLLFATADFSEEEIAHEKFCLRFKSSDIAKTFQELVKNVLEGKADKIIENPTQSEEDVQIISETQVTAEEEQMALRLSLPPKFLSYKQLPDCSCEQCKRDDEYLRDLFKDENTSSSTNFETKTSNLFNSSPEDANQSNESKKQLQFSLKPPSLISTSTLSNNDTKATFTFSCPLITSTNWNISSFPSGNSFTSNTSIFENSSESFGKKPSGSNPTTNFGNINLFDSFSDKGSITSKSSLFTFEAKPVIDVSNINVSEEKSAAPTSIIGNKTVDTTPANDLKKNDNDCSTTTAKTVVPDTTEVILKCDTNLSFASLAAKTTSDMKPAFTKSGECFSFLGAGAPVFGSLKTKSDTSDTVQSEEEMAQNNEDYDPHYEPIVPLPDAILVTTGEENENVLYNERAKLFRYDANTKEWKERGVGQLKILHHSEKNTYRLLLRREQVFKIVLNQRITPNFEMQLMATSEKAWMWAGYNYTDDENSIENLAVRFKNVQLANEFHVVIKDVISKLKSSYNLTEVVPESVQNFHSEDSNKDDEDDNIFSYDVSGNNEDYEYGEEEEEEEERTIMFSKECRLSKLESDQWEKVAEGDLQVYYDPELYASRIQVSDNSGNVLSNTIIGINTVMDINQKECTWKAVEWADEDTKWSTLKATFDTELAAEEFHSNYIESLNYAQQVGLIDEMPIDYKTEG